MVTAVVAVIMLLLCRHHQAPNNPPTKSKGYQFQNHFDKGPVQTLSTAVLSESDAGWQGQWAYVEAHRGVVN